MAEIRVELRDFNTTTNTFDIFGDLDIVSSDEFPLSLTYKNFDVRDITSRDGSFSKSFKIPATRNNNEIFDHIYQDGNVDTFNVRKDIPSTIYVDNLPIISGKLRISKVIKAKQVLEYECIFLGDNMDWANKIKNLELKDLEFSAAPYNTYPIDNITQHIFENPHGIEIDNDTFDVTNTSTQPTTHNDYVFNQDKFVYPLLSVGEGVSSKSQVTEQEFIPALYLKNIWDKIFQAQGYTVQSTFCNSEFFKSLIVPLNFERSGEQTDERLGVVKRTSDESLFDFEAEGNVSVPRAIGSPTSYDTDGAIQGSNDYIYFAFGGDQATDNYDLIENGASDTSQDLGNVQSGTASVDNTLLVKNEVGSHTLNFDVTVNAFNYKAFSSTSDQTMNMDLKFFIVRVEDDNDLTTITDLSDGQGEVQNVVYEDEEYDIKFYTGGINSNNQDFAFSGSVDVNDDPVGTKYMLMFRFRVRDYAGEYVFPFGGGDHGNVRLTFKEGSKFSIQGGTSFSINETIDSPQYLLPQGKQSDFISGVAQMFNLQFSTDAQSKVVKVEPYDNFYNETSGFLDWSDKIDYSQNIQEDFLYDIKSKLIFKYKEASSDAFLERYNKKNDIDWGSYKEVDESGAFFDGEYVVENKFFSPTFNWTEPDYTDSTATTFQANHEPVIPIYHKEFSKLDTTDERAEKSFDIGARILLLAPTNSLYSSQDGNNTFYHYAPLPNQNDADESKLLNEFCRANFIHIDNVDSSDNRLTLNNGFEDVDLSLSFTDVTFQSVENSGGSVTIKGLYYYYYNKMIKQLKQKPRVKILNINLTVSDICNLDFTNLVYLNGVYYRINKIVDFQPHKEQSTKVELVEFYNLGRDTNQLGETPNLENIRL